MLASLTSIAMKFLPVITIIYFTNTTIVFSELNIAVLTVIGSFLNVRAIKALYFSNLMPVHLVIQLRNVRYRVHFVMAYPTREKLLALRTP